MDFNALRSGFQQHFKEMSDKYNYLYEVHVDKDELWETYLESIPPEGNKIFRVRREHDCSCCRHFIKNIGNVVAIDNGKLISVWDFKCEDSKWDVVTKALSDYVKQFHISNVYFSKFNTVGTEFNFDNNDGEPIRFDHFYLELPDKFIFSAQHRDTLDTIKSQYRDIHNVFRRSLEELTQESFDIVADLINQGSLYRGDENKRAILTFRNLKKDYEKAENKELFVWEKAFAISPSVAKIRNTSIGTLLIDISEGFDLEDAVRKYEAVVAPENYKRSKPIFTKKMLEDAQQTITELGYLDSLERRYANVDDITVNNILFSNKDTAKRMKNTGVSNLFEELSKETKNNPKKFDRVEEISIDRFIADVLPTVTDLEAYVEGRHIPNFMSLIAPINKGSKTMFKWDNNFSWAYAGNVTDSIVKQNVKNAGGKVDGVLRFSIQWNDSNEYDANDLDAHCIEPTKNEIMFSNCRKPGSSSLGGQLDVDIINPERNVPAVENITWPTLERMKDGTYTFFVNCYSNRGGRSGFRAEIEFEGQIYSFDYTKPLHLHEDIKVADVILKNNHFSIKESLSSSCSSREIWSIHTNEFVPVTVMCYSPNYWNEQKGIGNKHYFFMLKDCVNPELPNGWYSEFLNSELYPQHRKVMEALSSKAHVQETEDQLSGLGFSSTLRNELVVKVKGATERVLKIKF